jgi:hypothetical protein
MILRLFTVYDSAAEAYLPPFYTKSSGEALRSFSDTCADTTHAFHKHPNDYTLFHVGQFDDTTCTFEINTAPTPLAHAHELTNREE